MYVPCTLDNDYNNIYRSSSKLNQEECKQKQQNTTTNTISIHLTNDDDDDDDEDIHPTEASTSNSPKVLLQRANLSSVGHHKNAAPGVDSEVSRCVLFHQAAATDEVFLTGFKFFLS